MAMVQTPGGGHGTSVRPPVAQNVSLRSLVGNQEVVKSGLSKRELEVFREVTKHRNKTVHFFHEAHTSNEASALKQEVARKQLTAWYFLHRLITEQWKDVFAPWVSQIADVDKKLRGLHEFLSVVFENLSSEIDSRKANGFVFKQCPSCGFESQQHEDEQETIYESECLVCRLTERSLQIECPNCGETVFFENEGFSSCGNCGKRFEPEDVADILIDDGAAHIAAKDGDESWSPGNCGDCEGYHTVVRTPNDEYVCASCFGVFESLQWCQWCNEPNTGDMENSYWAGCNFCDGKAGWDKDD
ncbi:hypothetical protein [Thiocapsa bogorovii]|uniref:hypothetical protein n=1 Tax=Thiocapsa bogorovii TaxID=521689 RepID=UPI001E3FA2E1|nr:hypothetical protein [Thiocapsa bogorovii]UHD17855.1 hypothetical protein LT988_07355 [Thiocapsa bogorovii]